MFSNIDKTHIPDDEKLLAVLSAIAAMVAPASAWSPSPDERPAGDLVPVVDGR